MKTNAKVSKLNAFRAVCTLPILIYLGACAPQKVIPIKKGATTTSSSKTKHGNAKKKQTKKVLASFYGKKFAGKRTASGETFRPLALTAAHPSLAFGTLVRVRNIKTNKSVVVKINDRGPHVPGRGIDLSLGAARILGMTASGIQEVSLEVIGKKHINSQ